MKLAHPMLNHPIEWNEDVYINTFVIENPSMYRAFLKELYDQEDALPGRFVLSENQVSLDISKKVEIINDVLKISTSSNKKIVSAITKELTDIAINDKHSEVINLYEKINETLREIIFLSGNDIVFDETNDISQIIKLYNVRPDDENLSLAEKILFHMELCEKYLNKKLFVFMNLHAYFSKEELEKLFKDFVYRKSKVLMIERYDVKAVSNEQKRIIDIDLCEI